MVFPLILAGIGLALGAVGAATSISAANQQKKAQQQTIAAQQEQERIRQEAMRVDADRRRRQMIREMLIARSTALSRASGAGATNSSALPGAYGQIGGQTGFGISGVNIQEQFGEELFASNQHLLAAKLNMANAQSTSQIGGALSSLGGTLIGNFGAFNNVFGNFKGGINYGQSTGTGIVGVGPYG